MEEQPTTIGQFGLLRITTGQWLPLGHKAACILTLSPDHNAEDCPRHDPFRVFWGGPDCPPRWLRDVLEARIHAVPAGGEILWITYYFRDEALATALVQAHRRGVRVKVIMEGNPREGAVNGRVLECLGGESGLGNGLRALHHRLRDIRSLKHCRLHEKLYYFSHPAPNVLVGTYNPSGNIPEDPAIIGQIGDQDRGHNLLVEILDSILVQELYEHALHLFKACHGPWECFLPRNNRIVASGKTRILFFPRLRWKNFDGLFKGVGSGSCLRMAVSHFNDPTICKRFFALSRRGMHIEVLAHDTERRVPSWVEAQMLQNGIAFRRYVHPEGLPMHNKFMLLETPERRVLAFGSLNLSVRSLQGNHELLVISEEPDLYLAFEQRWSVIFAGC